MLFAEGFDAGPIGWVLVIGGTVVASVVAYFNSNTKLMKRVDELTTRMFGLQDQVGVLQSESAGCLRREADLKAELTRASGRLALVEARQGVIPAAAATPGIVIADKDGRIREYSPSLTVFLGWAPDELKGQPISVLIPPEVEGQHEIAFKRVVAGAVLDPLKKIYTYALAKDQSRVPVVISVRRWGDGFDSLITATIIQRISVAHDAKPDAKESHP